MSERDIGWEHRGKTIKDLIAELNSFEDKDLKVELSLDGGSSSRPISLVGQKDGKYMLIFIPK